MEGNTQKTPKSVVLRYESIVSVSLKDGVKNSFIQVSSLRRVSAYAAEPCENNVLGKGHCICIDGTEFKLSDE
jgi:hypothetical protein